MHLKQSGFELKSWAFQQFTPAISERTEFWGGGKTDHQTLAKKEMFPSLINVVSWQETTGSSVMMWCSG